MCVIVDTSVLDKFINKENIFNPIWNWVENKRGKIVYTDTDKFKQEWELGSRTKKGKFWGLISTSKLKRVTAKKVLDKQREIDNNPQKYTLESNDQHIIALALVSRAKVLVSDKNGDKKLFEDFKRVVAQGKVYTRGDHDDLLKKDICP